MQAGGGSINGMILNLGEISTVTIVNNNALNSILENYLENIFKILLT